MRVETDPARSRPQPRWKCIIQRIPRPIFAPLRIRVSFALPLALPLSLPLLPDDELCLCFHVTKRKVENFLRVERPRRASQISECFGAGTGCGWCRPFLQRLFDRAATANTAADAAEDPAAPPITAELPTAEDYAQGRSRYVLSGGGTPPPGATPIQPAPLPDKPSDRA